VENLLKPLLGGGQLLLKRKQVKVFMMIELLSPQVQDLLKVFINIVQVRMDLRSVIRGLQLLVSQGQVRIIVLLV